MLGQGVSPGHGTPSQPESPSGAAHALGGQPDADRRVTRYRCAAAALPKMWVMYSPVGEGCPKGGVRDRPQLAYSVRQT